MWNPKTLQSESTIETHIVAYTHIKSYISRRISTGSGSWSKRFRREWAHKFFIERGLLNVNNNVNTIYARLKARNSNQTSSIAKSETNCASLESPSIMYRVNLWMKRIVITTECNNKIFDNSFMIKHQLCTNLNIRPASYSSQLFSDTCQNEAVFAICYSVLRVSIPPAAISIFSEAGTSRRQNPVCNLLCSLKKKT